jgi:hypothetical protein
MKKYYYLNENGNKKPYIGRVINDIVSGETYGILTTQELTKEDVELDFIEPIEEQEGWSSYFTYTDSEGNNQKYSGLSHNIRKNLDGSYYFTKVTSSSIELNRIDKIPKQDAYFSYIDENGKEQIYEGKPFYDKMTKQYYFYK